MRPNLGLYFRENMAEKFSIGLVYVDFLNTFGMILFAFKVGSEVYVSRKESCD